MARSVWKLPYFHASFLRISFNKSNKILLTASRSSVISSGLRHFRVGIYNGKSFRILRIRPEMFLFKFGEFSMTRRISSGIDMHINKSRKN